MIENHNQASIQLLNFTLFCFNTFMISKIIFKRYNIITFDLFADGNALPLRAAKIKDTRKFDAEYFGFDETQAIETDFCRRHLLEVVDECIKDAGKLISIKHRTCLILIFI